MSSLAASRADGYYHPPEWDPQQVGRDRYQGSKGANQWEQYGVIRFEMPYNIWCGGCGKHIRKGTRFNAKKNDVRAASPRPYVAPDPSAAAAGLTRAAAARRPASTSARRSTPST